MLTQGLVDVPTGDLWTEEQPATKPQAGGEGTGERGREGELQIIAWFRSDKHFAGFHVDRSVSVHPMYV